MQDERLYDPGDDLREAENDAMFQLGGLSGALRHCSAATHRILAGMLVSRTLMSALRREGHAFTDLRFHAWFAGLATLSDEARLARGPRATCKAILTELAHTPWSPLAERAVQLGGALLAPLDLHGDADHQQAQSIIAEARGIAERHAIRPGACPLSLLDDLHGEAARSTLFAPSEKAHSLLRDRRHARSEEQPLPSPYWALELFGGDWLRRQGALPFALPLPGVIRPETLIERGDAGNRHRCLHAVALAKVAGTMSRDLRDAADLAAHLDARLTGRSTSRAPALFELLAGFGPLRSSQLETALRASRLGIRGMLASLDAAGLLERSKVAGAVLFSAKPPTAVDGASPRTGDSIAFSGKAIDEYEASLAAVDRLLGSVKER